MPRPAVAAALAELPAHKTHPRPDKHSMQCRPHPPNQTLPLTPLSLALHQQDARHTTKKHPAQQQMLCARTCSPAPASPRRAHSNSCCGRGLPAWCEAQGWSACHH